MTDEFAYVHVLMHVVQVYKKCHIDVINVKTRFLDFKGNDKIGCYLN